MAIEKIFKFRADTKDVQDKLDKVKKQVQDTSNSSSKGVNDLSKSFTLLGGNVGGIIPLFNTLRTAVLSTGIGALAVAIGGITALFGAATAKASEFSSSMSKLRSVLGDLGTEDNMNKLAEDAKRLGATTAFTAVQVSELQTELAKLGFEPDEILNATEATLSLASSLGVSLADAATLAGSTVRSFGLSTTETQRVVDVLALSTSKSALDFSSLTESLKVAAPIAKATGLTIEKTGALLGVLANNGLKGSVAGTGLSKVLSELDKKGLSLEQAYEKVNKSSNKLQVATELVGTVGAKSLLNLASSGEQINKLENDLKGAEGAAAALAKIQLDNLAGDTTKLGSAWEGFLLNIEDGNGIFTKIARFGVQLLTDAIDGLSFGSDVLATAWDTLVQDLKDSKQIIEIGVPASFDKLGSKIKIFANNALLAISSIPIIGRAVDKEQAEKNIIEAEKLLEDANKRLAKVKEINDKRIERADTIVERARSKAVERVKTKALKDAQEEQLKIDAETLALTEEQRKKAAEAEKKRLQDVNSFREKLLNQQRDLNAKSEQDKLDLERKKAQEDLDKLKTTAKERFELQVSLNNLFNQKQRELEDKIERTAEEENKKRIVENEKAKEDLKKSLRVLTQEQRLEEERQNALEIFRAGNATQEEILQLELQFIDKANKLKADKDKEKFEAEKKLEADRLAIKHKALDDLTAIAGAESNVGRTLLIAKQLLNAKELILDVKKNITLSKTAVARAAIATAEGTAQTAKVGFPQNIPLLIGYAAQAAGIISAVKKAASKSGVSANISSPASIGSAPEVPSAPSFNIVAGSGAGALAQGLAQQNRPVQAFVVSGNVTTAQSLDRNIISNSRL